MVEPTSPLIMRRGAITKRQHTPSGQSQAEAGNNDSILIPLEGLDIQEPIAHQRSEEFYVESAIFQSDSWAGRNESTTRRNRVLTRHKTKKSTVVRNTSGSSGQSTLEVSEASYGNECSTSDKARLDPIMLRVEDVVEPPILSGGCASTSDNSESPKVLTIEKEGKAQTQFQLGDCIRCSPRASVCRAINWDTMQMVAVKQIPLDSLKTEQITQLVHDVDLVERRSHPNIIKFEGILKDNLRNTLSMVLEYAHNGSLERILEEFGSLNEKQVASCVIQVLDGLDYLHHNGIVHGNLKAANILITQSGQVKLSDFGISLYLRAIEPMDESVSWSWMPNWAAPEVIERGPVSTKSDIWSLGCTIIELLTGRPPYKDLVNTLNVMFRIVENDGPPIPEGLSDSLVAFLKDCFHKAPAQRPSANELSQHEWLNRTLNKDLQSQSHAPLTQTENTDQRKTISVTNTPTTTTTTTTTTTKTVTTETKTTTTTTTSDNNNLPIIESEASPSDASVSL